MAEEPRSTVGAPRTDLTALAAAVHHELVRRSEALSSSWIEEAADDLAAGRLTGWYYPLSADGGALGFFSVRARRAYGHVHVPEGPAAAERARQLLTRMSAALSPSIARFDVGLTGVSPTGEQAVVDRVGPVPGAYWMRRLGMERVIRAEDVETAPAPPKGLKMAPVRASPLEELTELDRRSFENTVDESLIGETPADNRRVIDEIVRGRLGRFLEEASTLLIDPGRRPVAAILTAEHSPHRAVFLDLMVLPERRHQGCATFLLRWGLRALWALGYARAGLWVTEANVPARTLYEGLGFRTVASSMIYRWSKPSADASAPAQPQAGR